MGVGMGGDSPPPSRAKKSDPPRQKSYVFLIPPKPTFAPLGG